MKLFWILNDITKIESTLNSASGIYLAFTVLLPYTPGQGLISLSRLDDVLIST